MATLQQQARALGDPTRHQIFRFVADSVEPVGVAELTEHFGVNHNAIRQHLAKLVAAELVIEAVGESSGRGRPRLQYTIDPRVDSCWGVAGPYERLSLWLAEMIRTGDTPIEVGRRAGRNYAIAIHDPDDPVVRVGPDGAVDALVEAMARHGFEPSVRTRGPQVSITLGNCPFESTALADPETVCSLHLGMAEGMAENLDGLVVDELVPTDPRRPRCQLRCHLTE
jgi:predicted ArsR family transcriptional regulator